MRGVYTIRASGLTLANQAVTLAFINPGTTCSLQILRCTCGQTGSTTSAQQAVQLNYQVTAFPTLVSATPTKMATLDQASAITGGTSGAAGTCGVNASAEGAGTKTVIFSDSFNVLTGWLWTPTPDEVIILSAGSTSGFGIHLPVAASSLSNWSVSLTYKEI